MYQYDRSAEGQTTREFRRESTVSKILELVENSSSRKSRSKLFRNFKMIYTGSLLRCIGTGNPAANRTLLRWD